MRDVRARGRRSALQRGDGPVCVHPSGGAVMQHHGVELQAGPALPRRPRREDLVSRCPPGPAPGPDPARLRDRRGRRHRSRSAGECRPHPPTRTTAPPPARPGPRTTVGIGMPEDPRTSVAGPADVTRLELLEQGHPVAAQCQAPGRGRAHGAGPDHYNVFLSTPHCVRVNYPLAAGHRAPVRNVCCVPVSCSSAGDRRVHQRRRDSLVGQVVGGQPLGVLAVLDQVVDGVGERLGQSAALLRGRRDQTLQSGAGSGELAGVLGRRRRLRGLRDVVGDARVRAEVGVDLARVQREVDGALVGKYLTVQGLALGLQFGLPFQQDLLLIGAGADRDRLAGQVLVVVVEFPGAGLAGPRSRGCPGGRRRSRTSPCASRCR